MTEDSQNEKLRSRQLITV